MKRRKEVQEAIDGLSGFDEVSWYQEWFNTVYTYIEGLEMMVDAAYKRLDELDEIV